VKVSNLRRATFNLPYPEGQWPYRNVNETVSTYLPVSDYVDAPFSFTLQKGLVTKMEVGKAAPRCWEKWDKFFLYMGTYWRYSTSVASWEKQLPQI